MISVKIVESLSCEAIDARLHAWSRWTGVKFSLGCSGDFVADSGLSRDTSDQLKELGVAWDNRSGRFYASAQDFWGMLDANARRAWIGSRSCREIGSIEGGACYAFECILRTIGAQCLRSMEFLRLHGTAVAIDGKNTIVLLGDSGAGKSTLASALISYGAALISDDLTLVDEEHKVEGLIPLSGLGLFPEALNLVFGLGGSRNTADKLLCAIQRTLHVEKDTSRFPLRYLVFLKRQEKRRAPAVSLVQPPRSVFELLRFTVSGIDIVRQPGAASYLDRVIRISHVIPCLELSYCHSWESLGEVCDVIARQVDERSTQGLGREAQQKRVLMAASSPIISPEISIHA